MADTDFRTPDEEKILSDFQFKLTEGVQWQVWHRGTLGGTYWNQNDAEISAKDAYSNGIWGDEDFRFRELWGGPIFLAAVLYYNLEIQSPTDKRWMTSDTFVVRVKITDTMSL